MVLKLAALALLVSTGCTTAKSISFPAWDDLPVDPPVAPTKARQAARDTEFPVTMVEIGPVSADDLAEPLALLKAAVAMGDKTVMLRINSWGGGVFDGLDFIAEIEELQKSGVTVLCVVDNRAVSMGFVILQSVCDRRLATKRSLFLAHNAHVGRASGTVHELNETVDMLKTANHAMAEIIADRLGMPLAKYEAKIDAQAWTFGADEALRVHAIDGFADPRKLPPVLRLE